jgi:hypothetical protein
MTRRRCLVCHAKVDRKSHSGLCGACGQRGWTILVTRLIEERGEAAISRAPLSAYTAFCRRWAEVAPPWRIFAHELAQRGLIDAATYGIEGNATGPRWVEEVHGQSDLMLGIA